MWQCACWVWSQHPCIVPAGPLAGVPSLSGPGPEVDGAGACASRPQAGTQGRPGRPAPHLRAHHVELLRRQAVHPLSLLRILHSQCALLCTVIRGLLPCSLRCAHPGGHRRARACSLAADSRGAGHSPERGAALPLHPSTTCCSASHTRSAGYLNMDVCAFAEHQLLLRQHLAQPHPSRCQSSRQVGRS